MVVKRRKKAVKYRGSQTHGGGAKKKRRGAGNRGGRGRAGTGKRGDAKKPSIWNTDYFGKKGFKPKNSPPSNAINLKTVEESITYWADKKLVEVKKDIYHVDLNKLGYNKLIGSGSLTKKINIVVERATDGAIESVKEAGGNVEVTEKVEIVKKTEAEKTEKASEA